jgi:type I protein arginine methyltransferase
MSYTDLSEHQWMIEDRVRTGAFEEAIRRAVRPGDAVLDFGCGLGILAMFAARAGARKVYAVDRLPIVRLAQAIAKKNGFGDIAFVFAPGEGFALPEKVDVIVSEWLGHFALQEGMIEPLCAARDAHLRPGGRMIPERVTMRAALVCEPWHHARRRFFQTVPYGIDFSPIAQLVFSEVTTEDFEPADLLSPAATLAELDLSTIAGLPPFVEGEIAPEREAEVFGIAGWFDADLGSGVRLDTSPHAPETHWKPLFFPFEEPLCVAPSRPVRLRISPVQHDEVHTRWRWWATDGKSERSGDDMTLLAHLRRPLAAGMLR